jgi:thiol-disulfide isomerase/thioredoxin
MKKLLLSLFFAAAGITANAQLANGSTAPDFTATDINGVTHHLYDYLNSGKTVIIDVSATWCGPCWNYHHTGALEDIYNSYGEGGSNEIVVLFIEGDPGTSVSSIYGVNVSGDNGTTQGDWTVGSPYPIIDDGTGSISDSYEIAYFPTVYRICPNGIVTELTQPTAAQVKTSVNNGCGTLTGPVNKAKLIAGDGRFCEQSGSFKASFKNYSGSAITSASFALKDGDAVIATKEYTGSSVNTFDTGTVAFDSFDFGDGGTDYSLEITNINAGTPDPAGENMVEDLSITTNASTESSNNIVVTVYTDTYPSEMKWKIYNSAGETVHSQTYTNTTANKNTTKTHYITLPDGVDCYDIELIDTYGDGWTWGSTQHGISVTSGETVLFENDGNIGFGLYTQAVLKTNGTLGSQNVVAQQFNLYPNPTTGILNISTTESVDVTVFDISGKAVYTASSLNNGDTLNLSNLQKGMYIAQVKGENTIKTEKVIIK